MINRNFSTISVSYGIQVVAHSSKVPSLANHPHAWLASPLNTKNAWYLHSYGVAAIDQWADRWLEIERPALSR